MKQRIGIFLLIVPAALAFSTGCALGQIGVLLKAYPTATAGGETAIYVGCEADNDWSADDYEGVEAICQLQNPYGETFWPSSGGFASGGYQAGTSYAATNPYVTINADGEWDAEAQFGVEMYLFDSESNTYSDFDGYSNVGTQDIDPNTVFPVYGDGNFATVFGNTYEFAESSWTLDVSTTVQTTPATAVLDGGEEQTFTATVNGASQGGSSLCVTWTLTGGTAGSSTCNTYTYTAPASVSANQNATLKACSVAIPSICDTVAISVLAPTITTGTPSPQVLLADGMSTSSLYAELTNASDDATVTWTADPAKAAANGTIPTTGNTTATFTAANAATTTGLFAATSNTVPVTVTGCITGSSPQICGSPASTLTLVQPVTITSVSPSSWSAGSNNVPLTITGTGFSANSQVTVNNPNTWTTITLPCNPTANPTTISCTLSVGANLSNVSSSQNVSVTVTTPTDGLTSTATSSAIPLTAIAYTYAITLSASTTSLTYGATSTITPHVACKIATGAACPSGVANPQTANFSITAGLGSLSSTGNASSTVFTDNALIPYPSQNTSVQGCATQTFTLPATTVTLNPATVPAPLGSGKTQAFSATIANQGTANSLNWTLAPSPSSAAAGTLASATTAITQQGSPASGASSNTYTAPNPIAAPAAVTLNACMTANSKICATPVVIDLPGFSLAATNNNPSQTALSLGHSMSYTIAATALDGFNGTIALAVGGLPAGVTATLSAPSIATSASGAVTLTLTAAYSASTFIGTSTITVTGTSGSESAPASFALTTRPLQYAGSCGVPATVARFYPNPLAPY